VSIIEQVLAAVEDVDGVEVLGTGPLADALAAVLGERRVTGTTAPAAVVETTGDPQAIAAALGRVADLGTVVLAGPPPPPFTLDLYEDLHVRALTVVGIAAR